MVQSPKMMIIIVWSLIDFHAVDVLPKGRKFNAHHYISVILQSLTDWHIGEVAATDRKLIVHADNTRSHTVKVSLAFIEQNGMKRTAYMPCSSDLLPSDFFRYIKGILSDRSFQSADNLLSEI
jgi:hypothetical protein